MAGFELVLVRHAQAAPAPLGRSDADRVLTQRGRQDATQMAVACRSAIGGKPLIVTSPRQRAVETAEILAEGLGSNPPETALFLDGDADPETILGALSIEGDETLVIVGHEPDMGRLLARLLDPAWRGSIPFPAGAFAQVTIESIPPRRPGKLLTFWSP